MVFVTVAEPGVDPIGQDNEVGFAREAFYVVYFGLADDFDTQLLCPLMKDQQERPPRATAEPIAADSMPRALEVDFDVIPICEGTGNPIVAFGVVGLEVPLHRAVQVAGPDRAEGELDGRVAVALGRLHLGDRVRPGLDDRDRHDPGVLVEDLGHAQLDAEEAQEQAEQLVEGATEALAEARRLADEAAQSARAAAEEVARSCSAVHLLVNNAAVFLRERAESPDGMEMTFQVNYLSHFLLSNLLLDRLKAAGGARVVNMVAPVDSIKLDFDDLMSKRSYSFLAASARSKLALVLAARRLSERLADTGAQVICYYPGLVRSGLFIMPATMFSPVCRRPSPLCRRAGSTTGARSRRPGGIWPPGLPNGRGAIRAWWPGPRRR